MPSAEQQAAEADVIAKRKSDEAALAAQTSDLENQRQRRASKTDVGGAEMRAEEQFGRGLLKSTQRRNVSRTLYGG
jgi:hypothetical protein